MSLPLAEFELHFGRVHACLREVCGHDEMLVASDDTRTALRLIDRLLVAGEGLWPPPGQAAALTAPERDRVLAEIWLRTFGSRITGSPRCAACGALFDSSFRLEDLLASVWPHPPATEVALPGGRRYRVPTGADELAVAGLAREDALRRLVARCALSDGADTTAADALEVNAALERAAPVLDLDLDAACPECGGANAIAFRIQFYLLRALSAARAQLPTQLHTLAQAYGWSISEILDLSPAMRLQLMRLAEGALSPRRAA